MGKAFTPFEDEVLIQISNKYTNKVIAKVLRRSETVISNRRRFLGLRKNKQYLKVTKKIILYKESPLGNPSNYYESEGAIWRSLLPKYYISDLEGDELEILNTLNKLNQSEKIGN